MESTVSTKKSAARKPAAKKSEILKADAAEPFAAVAEPGEPKKPAAKKTVAKAVKPAKPTAKIVEPTAKPLKRRAKAVAADPFAELAEATSPVKAAAKTAKKAKATVAATAAKTVKAGKKPVKKTLKTDTPDETLVTVAVDPLAEMSPVFKILADVELPDLKRENRARLQMQTPTRLYFYWSLRENPWATLRSVFGNDLGSYALVVKLIDNHHGREEITLCDAEGDWWFNVEPNGSYTAELGFYATNRPYFRIIYSNTVETPRRAPSPRSAAESDWRVSAAKFAEVLDVAGFTRDAFDVAVAGDNFVASESATHRAFADLVGGTGHDLSGVAGDDIRYAMMALAAGSTLEELRFKISPALFAILQANVASIEAGKAMNALTEHFDIDESEFFEDDFGPAVYGVSLINFPKTLKTRTASTRTVSPKYAPRYNPVSSFSIGR